MTNGNRQAEAHLRMLCTLPLGWSQLMPELFEGLRAVVPFPQGVFIWSTPDLGITDRYAEWDALRNEGADEVFCQEFLAKGRQHEVFRHGSELARLPAVSRYAQCLRLDASAYRRHEYYNLVARPGQYHHTVHVRLARRGGLMAGLTCNRPPGDPDFTPKELQTLERLLPFLGHALSNDGGDYDGRWVDAAEGLLICDEQGLLRHVDAEGEKLMDIALERPRVPGVWKPLRRELLLAEVLKELSRRLEAIRRGDADAVPPVVKHANGWGRFEFRASWLNARQPGDGGLLAIRLKRRVPLPLKLAESLRHSPLSLRERQVALGIASGDTYGRIAQQLHISERTAIAHARNLLDKLGLAARGELIGRLLGD